MKKVPSVLFIGGFLGAGKTTAIKFLASMLASRGLKAAAITNDQAAGLVDTFFLSGSGVPAEEVAGSCFCCNFHGLADSINHSIDTVAPDVILAEPVGSCTDIVATVIRPMRALMKDKVVVRGYSVLFDPGRWTELFDDNGRAPWSMKYLFDKQLSEADFILINKVDTLGELKLQDLESKVATRYPDSTVLAISAKAGTGMEKWLDVVGSAPPGERWLKEIDYEKYAAAEAKMGWLNAEMRTSFGRPVDGKAVLTQVAEALTNELAARKGKIGHLKLLAVGETGSIKAGITQVGGTGELEGMFRGPLSEIDITVNIRAETSPGDLAEIVCISAQDLRKKEGAVVDVSFLTTFRPGAPRPTYRFAAECPPETAGSSPL